MPATTGGAAFFWWLLIGAVAIAALWWLFVAPGRIAVGERTGRGVRDDARRREDGHRGGGPTPAWTERQGDGRAGVTAADVDKTTGEGPEKD